MLVTLGNCWKFGNDGLSDPTEIPPPYRKTGVMAYRNPKTGLTRGASQKKLASEAYRAMGGVA